MEKSISIPYRSYCQVCKFYNTFALKNESVLYQKVAFLVRNGLETVNDIKSTKYI